jgi:hypothetical protein
MILKRLAADLDRVAAGFRQGTHDRRHDPIQLDPIMV